MFRQLCLNEFEIYIFTSFGVFASIAIGWVGMYVCRYALFLPFFFFCSSLNTKCLVNLNTNWLRCCWFCRALSRMVHIICNEWSCQWLCIFHTSAIKFTLYDDSWFYLKFIAFMCKDFLWFCAAIGHSHLAYKISINGYMYHVRVRVRAHKFLHTLTKFNNKMYKTFNDFNTRPFHQYIMAFFEWAAEMERSVFIR